MPNWCRNTLVITGPEEEVAAFQAAIKGRDSDDDLMLDFGAAARDLPSEALDMPLPCGRVQNPVGVGFYVEVTREEGRATVRFESKWAPPREMIAALATAWAELRLDLSYVEPHGRFQGQLIAEAGMVVLDEAEECDSLDQALAS